MILKINKALLAVRRIGLYILLLTIDYILTYSINYF